MRLKPDTLIAAIIFGSALIVLALRQEGLLFGLGAFLFFMWLAIKAITHKF